MGAPYGKICSKVEDAFGGVIAALQGVNTGGVQLVKGFQGDTVLTVPRIHVICDSAAAEVIGDHFTGNWTVDVAIALVTQYKDTARAARETMSAELFDMVLRNDIEDKLNNQGGAVDFHAYGGAEGEGEGFIPTSIMRDPVDHSFVEMLTGTLYCRPSS